MKIGVRHLPKSALVHAVGVCSSVKLRTHRQALRACHTPSSHAYSSKRPIEAAEGEAPPTMNVASLNSMLETVESIYAAALGPTGWRSALSQVAAVTGSTSSVMMQLSKASQSSLVMTSDGIGQDCCDVYQSELCSRDDLHFLIDKVSYGELIDSREMLGQDGLKLSRVYDQWYGPHGIYYFTGAVLRSWSGGWVALCINRSEQQGAHGADDVQRLRQLLPHLQNSICISDALGDNDMKSRLSLDALNGLSQGVVLFDPDGRIMGMNSSAEALTEDSGPFRVVDGRLEAREAVARSLCAAIHQLDIMPATIPRTFPLVLNSSVGRTPAWALLLKADEPMGWRTERGAILIIQQPEKAAAQLEHDIQEAYKLTPAEARVAAAATVSPGIDNIATQLALSRETVRTHLKRVFLKCGATNQAELIKELLVDPRLKIALSHFMKG